MIPALVVVHRGTGVVALNVLSGALRHDPRTRELPIVFARDRAAVVEAVRAHPGALVAWSFYSLDAPRTFEDLAWVRARCEAIHVAGGVHATAEPRATLEAGFDLVALGEGERTLVDLALAGPAARVSGLGRLEDGLYRDTGSGVRVDLDDHPPFNAVDRKWNAIEITRGCVYACSFCQTPYVFKARFRHRSVADVRRHVRTMREAGLRYVRFLSPTSLSYGATGTSPDLDAVDALLAAVREEIGPDGKVFFGTFPSEVRPEHVTPEALAVLRRWVDNDNLVIGGQSGSERVLAASRRDHGVEDVERAVRHAVEAGFLPNVDFLFGLPGEDDEDVAASVALMERLVAAGARIHTHAFLPLPGTPLRGAKAAVVPEVAARALERLESRGQAYGVWRRQVEASAALVQLRRR